VIFALLVFLCPVYEKWRPPPLESALLLVFEGERCLDLGNQLMPDLKSIWDFD